MTEIVDRKLSVAEFEEIFESVKNWGRWGPDDELGTLNLITPERVRAAAGLVHSGRRVSMAIPINTVAGPDNPNPATRFVTQAHDVPVDGSKVRFGLDWLGMAAHGDCHTHVDALCHISYDGQTYNGRVANEIMLSTGAIAQDMAVVSEGVVGRGVMLDIAGMRGIDWLEPGEAITAADLDACLEHQGVDIGEGDILVLRTGHHARRLALGPWDNGPDGEGKAGVHVDAIPWMHERGIAAFLPDGDGETVPSVVEGITYPIHPLQVVAMGMLVSDSLQFEELIAACREEQRYEFMVVGLPLRLPGGTGCPWNPIAIF
ncbi:MAG TPA: cyclase family protein [Solirubrobacteraceae bacterium]